MEACVVLCRSNKPDDRKNKVLFIDAKDKVTRKNSESYLEPEHIKEIVNAYNKIQISLDLLVLLILKQFKTITTH